VISSDANSRGNQPPWNDARYAVQPGVLPAHAAVRVDFFRSDRVRLDNGSIWSGNAEAADADRHSTCRSSSECSVEDSARGLVRSVAEEVHLLPRHRFQYGATFDGAEISTVRGQQHFLAHADMGG